MKSLRQPQASNYQGRGLTHIVTPHHADWTAALEVNKLVSHYNHVVHVLIFEIILMNHPLKVSPRIRKKCACRAVAKVYTVK